MFEGSVLDCIKQRNREEKQKEEITAAEITAAEKGRDICEPYSSRQRLDFEFAEAMFCVLRVCGLV